MKALLSIFEPSTYKSPQEKVVKTLVKFSVFTGLVALACSLS